MILSFYTNRCAELKKGESTEWLWRTVLLCGNGTQRLFQRRQEHLRVSFFGLFSWLFKILAIMLWLTEQCLQKHRVEALHSLLHWGQRAVAFTHLQGYPDCSGTRCLFKVTDTWRNSSTSPKIMGERKKVKKTTTLNLLWNRSDLNSL